MSPSQPCGEFPTGILRRTLLAGIAGVLSRPIHAQVQDLFRITNGSSGSHVEYHRIEIAPGAQISLADLRGPGKITYFYFTDDSFMHPTDGSGCMYPGLVLKIAWDEAPGPSIQVPLWNFFGAFSRKSIDYQSVAVQINHHCYMSYLPMPFGQRAHFTLANDGDELYSRSVAYGIDYERDSSYDSENSRLHALWRRSNPTRNGVHRMLDVSGRGQYIGNFLQVDTNYEGWWGEGDTIFQIDGNTFTHSPGTEDEYGSAWGFDHTYSYIYSGYIEASDGHNRMYRWYVTNPVRFQKALAVDIQDQRFENGQIPSSDDLTSVAYFYLDRAFAVPPLAPYHERIAPSQRASYPRSK